MKLNHAVLRLLKPVAKRSEEIQKYLTVDSAEAKLHIDSHELLKLNEDGIILAQKVDLERKILPNNIDESTIDIELFEEFIEELGLSIIRLNHVGVSHYAENIDQEIQQYKEQLLNTYFQIYTESSEDEFQKWYFIGNKQNPTAPLVEIVLTKDRSKYNEWIPHFQIDFDTNLSFEEIEAKTRQFYGADFLKWKMDIPEVGVVLTMALLGEVEGIKVALGIGTKLQDVQYHREEDLKKT